MDYDAIIVGCGPAGLTAGIEIARANRRVLILDRETFGGRIMNVETVTGYPTEDDRVQGAMLASRMVNEAQQAGVTMELAEVVEIESYSECVSVTCADGKGYTAYTVILAGGVQDRRMGVPGEDKLQGKGVIHCALCDAGLYRDKAVAVCGGGYAGLIEALYFAKLSSKVIVIEAQPELTGKPVHQERARANPKMEIRCGEKAVEILGDEFVTGVVVENTVSRKRETIAAQGVLVHVGFEPVTGWLGRMLPLDKQGFIAVNGNFETDVPGIFAAGDIRHESPRRTAAAVADGKAAAAGVLKFLSKPR